MAQPYENDLDQTMTPKPLSPTPSPMAPIPVKPKIAKPNPLTLTPQNPLAPKPMTGAPPATSGPGASPITVNGPVAPQPVAPQGPTQYAGMGAVGLTPTDPNRSLTTQTITPGAQADRMAIAQQRFDQFAASTSPAYQAALRDANRYGAATGRLGSGSLRTDFGNLANQRSQALDLARQGFLTDATEGSIEDAWRSIGLAERQQGFQNTQQEQAWQRALDQFGVGSASNPYNARQDLGAMYGERGQAGSEALQALLSNVPMRQTPVFNPTPGLNQRRPFFDPTRVIPGVTDQ